MPTNQETVDMTSLGFAIDIDDAITLKIQGANVYPDGDCLVEINIDGAEVSVSLQALTTVVNELNRFSKNYYPPEEDDSTTPLATSA